MPIYEYRCESCGHELEKLQRMSDDRLVDCPLCNEPRLKRLISAVSFRLKGSGWYETDFKKDNQRNLAESDKPEPDKSESGKKESGSAGSADKKPGGSESSKTDKTPATTAAKPVSSSGKASTA